MAKILVLADEPWVRNEVHAALTDPELELIDHVDPTTAAQTALDGAADAVVADLQVGSMGGMAVARAVREATADGEDPGLPVILLLDRTADIFLARRAGAAAWVTKPFTSHELSTALGNALATDESPAGGHEDDGEDEPPAVADEPIPVGEDG